MRRGWKWITIPPALFAIIVLSLFAFFVTASGQNALSAVVFTASGGKLSVSGVTVHFPGTLIVRSLTVRDKNGPWLTADNARIDGSFVKLLLGQIDIQRATVFRMRLSRFPVSDDTNSSWPQIDVAVLNIPDIETDAALTQAPMRFSAAGSVHVQSADEFAGDIALIRRDGPGSYSAKGQLKNGAIDGVLALDEPSAGLVTGLLGLNAIGPIRADIRGNGPPASNRFSFTVNAGSFHARGAGVAQLPARAIDLDFSADAPAMELRRDVSWQSLAAEGHAHGPIDALVLDARFRAAKIRAGGLSAEIIQGTASGSSGSADLTASASRLSVSGMDAGLLSGAPVELRAHMRLDAPHWPAEFTIAHPLVAATGQAQLDGSGPITAKINLSNLEPVAALAGVELRGSASFAARMVRSSTLAVALNGRIATTGGQAFIVAALGPDAQFDAAADLNGATVSNLRLTLKGGQAEASIRGAIRDGQVDLSVSGTAKNLSKFVPDLNGDASMTGHATGPLSAVKLSGSLSGVAGFRNIEPQPVKVSFDATGTAENAAGSFRADTRFRNSGLAVAGAFGWAAHVLRVELQNGKWKGISLHGDGEISPAGPMHGAAVLHAERIGDLEPWLGVPISGTADAQIELSSGGRAAELAIKATGNTIALQDTSIAHLSIDATIENSFAAPRLSLTAIASGVSAKTVTGSVTAGLKGTLDDLSVITTANLRDSSQRELTARANLMLRMNKGEALLNTASLDMGQFRANLVEPATVAFGDGVTVSRLWLQSGGAQISVSGRFTPMLVADVNLDGVSAAQLQSLLPSLSDASVSGVAHLTGTLSEPRGTVAVTGRGLRLKTAPATLAPGTLNAQAELNGAGMQLDASLDIGGSKLTVLGEAPLARDGGLDLKATGTADLSLFNVDLAAAGRRVLGKAVINAVVHGTPVVPDISGSVELRDAEIQDGADGFRVAGISGAGMFRGSTVQIVNLSGRAGVGTIKVSGNIDLGAPGIPVRLTLTARNAEPVSSDSFHANLDADMTMTGSATGRLQLAGKVVVHRAESVLPNSLPPTVTALNVARPSSKEMERPAAVRSNVIALDLDISSPGQLFVRGRGLDAELEGNLHVGGTLASPVPTGAFQMRRGTFDLGGAMLNFTSGKVTFQNASLRNGLDPELDFVAQSATGNYTAKLEVTGTVLAPKVQLSSTPTLPQDEILSQLLFHQNVKQLTALQLAQMAQAAASLGGFSGGFDPLGSARRLLGLDRLSVVSGPNNQTQVEAGKYVSRNIYVGAKQGLSNAPQAEVQIDLTKHLKARAAIATGSNATVTQGNQQQDPGTSAGLSWQFEY